MSRVEETVQPPVHGGNLVYAKAKWPSAPEPWLDLSAALNPIPWPIPNIPPLYYQNLPDIDYLSLRQAAANYYCQPCLWPVSGTQQLIECLPRLRARSVVAVPEVGYAEHEWCWQKAGHKVLRYSTGQVELLLSQCDVLVVINPNNPTGELISLSQLRSWHQQLQAKGGWLVVDEAFIDSFPLEQQLSMASYANQPGLIVLKSIGKFFGLAGIRSGFVLAEEDLLSQVKQYLGPWHLNGISAYLTERLLEDLSWHQCSREQLARLSYTLSQKLAQQGFVIVGQTPLFVTVLHLNAKQVQAALAEQGIWVRLFEDLNWLRFGLPANTEQSLRLQQALQKIENIKLGN